MKEKKKWISHRSHNFKHHELGEGGKKKEVLDG
jgi:hypothetical protein